MRNLVSLLSIFCVTFIHFYLSSLTDLYLNLKYFLQIFLRIGFNIIFDVKYDLIEVKVSLIAIVSEVHEHCIASLRSTFTKL